MRESHLDAIARIDESRLWARHQHMATIGAIPGNGVNRAALSAEDIEARKVLIGWARECGFGIAQDALGNLFIRRPGSDPNAPPVMTGSHMDSQPRGGRFDGMYGVLAGLEALQAIDAARLSTRHPIELVVWTNEEGSRFQPCTMGSAVFTGARRIEDVLDATDNEGIRFGDALASTLAAMPDVPPRAFGTPAAAYIEAHIEQGPLLENADKTVGVVTGIQGLRWYNVEIFGKTDHAGTTPLALRKDAVRDAINVINALRTLTHDPTDVTRFTVGRMLVTPNSPNSVANHVLFSVDIRHPDQAVIERLGCAVEPTVRAALEQCTFTITPTLHDDPCLFDDAVVTAVERAAIALDIPHMRITSGASHDANYMARICPSGMIFVPCAGGVSHNEAEDANPADLAAGARVLAAALLDLADRV